MNSIDRLLEVDFIHNSLIKIATSACILAGLEGDRRKLCPEIVQTYSPSIFWAVENSVFSRDRVCIEKLALCKDPTITEIDMDAKI